MDLITTKLNDIFQFMLTQVFHTSNFAKINKHKEDFLSSFIFNKFGQRTQIKIDANYRMKISKLEVWDFLTL